MIDVRQHFLKGRSSVASTTLGIFLPALAQAQSVPPPSSLLQPIAPSQITPGGNRQLSIDVPITQGTPLQTAPTVEAPPGSDQLALTLRDVSIEGGFPELIAAQEEFRRDVIGRKLTLAEVYGAASRLENAYSSAGFVLVRIAIPPQRIEDGGSLHLTVIDGVIEGIDDAGLPRSAKG